MTIVKIIFSIIIMLIGATGGASKLNEKPNTATIVFLTGVIGLLLSL